MRGLQTERHPPAVLINAFPRNPWSRVNGAAVVLPRPNRPQQAWMQSVASCFKGNQKTAFLILTIGPP